MSKPLLDLVIMRHGEAEYAAASDRSRRLTDAGRKCVSSQARKLVESGFKTEAIIHSPYVRTTQTAELCQRIMLSPDVRPDDALLHGANPMMVPLVWQGLGSVLIVSHMPLVGRLIQYLCPQSEIHGLPVAGFVRLSLDPDTLEATLADDGRSY